MRTNTFQIAAAIAIVTASSAICAEPTPSPKIEIKGLKTGISRKQASELYPHLAAFHVADVFSKYQQGPSLQFDEQNQLVSVMFFFDSAHFDDVLSAVKSKYPKTSCSREPVTNGFGAQFAQVKCQFSSSGDTLSVSRFVSDIDTSALTLSSNAWAAKRAADNRSQKDKDI